MLVGAQPGLPAPTACQKRGVPFLGGLGPPSRDHRRCTKLQRPPGVGQVIRTQSAIQL
jgi:hypothetical protein